MKKNYIKFKWFFIILILSFCFSHMGFSKELSHRLGLGFKNQFSNNLAGIAAQYYPNSDMFLTGILGIDTKKDDSKFGFMVRLNRIIFKEDNLNFYMGGGIGLISSEVYDSSASKSTDSGFELIAIIGSEFFFQGLENLGFSFEAGIGVSSVKSGVRFRTIGDSVLRAGIMFYF